ncbi:MAG: EpsG family protein [Oscillospiraceae bacterium]|nr:EpsG family protein [Oscillospiraceae bacterium]
MVYIIAFMFSLIIHMAVSDKQFAINGTVDKNLTNSMKATLAMFPIFIIAAVRYDVGVDYNYAYTKQFDYTLNGIYFEPRGALFQFLVEICTKLSSDYAILFVVTSWIIYYFFLLGVYKYSENIYLSFILFGAIGIYFYTLNQVRQFIVVAVIISIIDYVYTNKKAFLIVCVIMFFVHSAALEGIILFLVCHILKKKNKKLVFIISASAVVLSPFFDMLMNYLFPILYSHGLLAYGTLSGNVDTSIVNLVFSFLAMAMYLVFDKSKNDLLGVIYQNTTLIYFVLSVLSDTIPSSERILRFFSPFLILSIPYFLMQIKNKKSRFTVSLFLVLFFLCVTVYVHYFLGYDKVFPYQTIWER